MFVKVNEVDLADVEEIEAIHATIDVWVADDGLQPVLLLIARSLAIAVVLSTVLAEIEWVVLPAD